MTFQGTQGGVAGILSIVTNLVLGDWWDFQTQEGSESKAIYGLVG